MNDQNKKFEGYYKITIITENYKGQESVAINDRTRPGSAWHVVIEQLS